MGCIISACGGGDNGCCCCEASDSDVNKTERNREDCIDTDTKHEIFTCCCACYEGCTDD